MIDLFSRQLREKDFPVISNILTDSLKIGASVKTFSKCILDVHKENKIFNANEFAEIEQIFNFKLDTNQIELFTPVPCMISNSFADYDALEKRFAKQKIGTFVVEEKYDGERIQVS